MSKIEHFGRVISVEKGSVKVVFEQLSACASCSAKDVCSASEKEEKVVEIACDGAFEVGEKVAISAESSLGLKAVILAYVVPFLLVLSVLILLSVLGVWEALAGILSLLAAVPYFFILYLKRKNLKRFLVFELKKLT